MKRIHAGFLAICAVGLICSIAGASTTYSIDPATISASPGDTGDSFDVFFTNNGPDTLSVAAFSFEVSVADTDITLTGADYSTVVSPYIFAGNSFFQDLPSPLNFVNIDGYSPQILDAADLTNDGTGVSIGAGQSADLGTVFFDVADPAQAGPFTVSFTGEVSDVANANNLSTPDAVGISVDSFSSATINVASVPEPSSILPALLVIAIPIIGPFARKRARQIV
jgi:hypothetical protein